MLDTASENLNFYFQLENEELDSPGAQLEETQKSVLPTWKISPSLIYKVKTHLFLS